MTDAEGATGDGVDRGAVGPAVVGEQLLHGDAVAGVERDRTPQEGDDGDCCLIGKNLGVGQTGAVIDRDVNILPAGELA